MNESVEEEMINILKKDNGHMSLNKLYEKLECRYSFDDVEKAYNKLEGKSKIEYLDGTIWLRSD